ncbi:hypothetical protein [Chitinilyticum litopenaei]|nr:hypothetical protein [Chitinilyticum litopenaei]
MPITLESIQAKQDELAAMIAALQGQVKFEAMFPIEVSAPQLPITI